MSPSPPIPRSPAQSHPSPQPWGHNKGLGGPPDTHLQGLAAAGAAALPRAPLPCREGVLKGTVCMDGLRGASVFTHTYVRGTYGA